MDLAVCYSYKPPLLQICLNAATGHDFLRCLPAPPHTHLSLISRYFLSASHCFFSARARSSNSPRSRRRVVSFTLSWALTVLLTWKSGSVNVGGACEPGVWPCYFQVPRMYYHVSFRFRRMLHQCMRKIRNSCAVMKSGTWHWHQHGTLEVDKMMFFCLPSAPYTPERAPCLA